MTADTVRREASPRVRIGGHYEALDPVGEGRIGVVHPAVDASRAGRRVALKLLRPDLSDPETITRFRADLERLRGMTHPHLVPTLGYGFDRSAGRHFATAEFAQGVSLATLLATGGSAAPADRPALAVQLLRALEFLHARGIVHGGITSNDIFLDSGRARLGDAGFQALRRAAWSGMTFPYDAPETASRPADARSDLYSLGVCLVELGSGTRIRADDEGATLARAMALVADPALRAVAARMTEADPSLRYDRPAEAVADLDLGAEGRFGLEDDATKDAYILGAGFVGRENELKTLAYALDATEIRAVAVEGEPGIGKNELLAEFGRRCRVDDIEYLEASCYRTAKEPFPVFADVLRACLTRAPRELVEEYGPELKKLLPFNPKLADVQANPAYDPASERHALARSIAEFVVETCMSREGQTVLAVNDLQWIDEGSLKALGILMDETKRRDFTRWKRLVLCVAYRPEGAERAKALSAHGAVREIRLEPFDERQSALLFEAVFGRDRTGPALAENVGPVWRRAKGNPFLVVETLRDLLASGRVVRTPRAWELTGGIDANAVPSAVEELLVRRLDDLAMDGDQRRTLETLALLGRASAMGELSALAGSTLADCEELASHKIVRMTSRDGEPAFAVAHDPLRLVVIAHMDDVAGKSRELARRIAESNRRNLDGHAEELFRLAVLAGDRADVVRHGTRLVETLYDLGEVNRFLATADEVIEAIGRDTKEALPVRARAVFMSLFTWNPETTKAALAELIEDCARHGDLETECWAYRTWGDAHFPGDTPETVNAYFDRAIDGYRSLGNDRELALTLHLKGSSLISAEENPGAALVCMKEALAVAGRCGADLIKAFCVGNLSRIDALLGRYEAAFAGSLESNADMERHHSQVNLAHGDRYLAFLSRKLGKRSLADDYLDKALAICRTFDIGTLRFACMLDRLEYALDDGDLPTAARLFPGLESDFKKGLYHDMDRFNYELTAARARAAMGRTETALAAFRDLLARCSKEGERARIHEELFALLGTRADYAAAKAGYRKAFRSTKCVKYRERLEILERLRAEWRTRGMG